MKPSKVAYILISAAISLCGCYSYSSLAKDEPILWDKDARFQLKDGSLVEASAGQYTRIEGGYQVAGTIVRQDTVQSTGVSGVRKTVIPFSGTIHDADIKDVTAYQYDGSSTVLAIVLSVTIVSVAVAVLFSGSFFSGPLL